MADWQDEQPTYEELLMMVQAMGREVMRMHEDLAEIKKVKELLKASEYKRAELARKLVEANRKLDALRSTPTPAMLQSAASYILKQEMEAVATLKKLPMVKDPKTGKWIPKV